MRDCRFYDQLHHPSANGSVAARRALALWPEVGSGFAMDLSSSSPRSAEATIGERYRLLGRLGSGAHGTVYEASHVHLDRRYAVKVFGAPDEERQGHGRFEREARLLSRLSHENIVSVIDAGVDPVRGQYLVLELIEGRTLRAELQAATKLSLVRAYEIVRQVASGLTYAHRQGVIHRDLKPENIMLSTHPDGRLLVKVLDFGIARLVDPGSDAITRSGIALGTAAYMAPEQARGERELDERADVFALGVVAYELVAGARPFDGESYNETLFRITTQPHTPLRQHCPDVGVDLVRVFDAVLTKDKSRRFASVQAFVAAFRAALSAPDDVELQVRESDTLADTLAGPSLFPRAGVSPVGEARARASGAVTRRLALMGVVVLVLVLGVWWSQRPRESLLPDASVLANQTLSLPPAVSATFAHVGLVATGLPLAARPTADASFQPANASAPDIRQVVGSVATRAERGGNSATSSGQISRGRSHQRELTKPTQPDREVSARVETTAPEGVTEPVSAKPPNPGYVLDNPY